VSRARAAGLRTRPLRETIAAVLDEGVPSDPDDRRLKGKLTREREAALMAKFAKAESPPTGDR
jgi:2'-hydroxyisoflavone reductase